MLRDFFLTSSGALLCVLRAPRSAVTFSLSIALGIDFRDLGLDAGKVFSSLVDIVVATRSLALCRCAERR